MVEFTFSLRSCLCVNTTRHGWLCALRWIQINHELRYSAIVQCTTIRMNQRRLRFRSIKCTRRPNRARLLPLFSPICLPCRTVNTISANRIRITYQFRQTKIIENRIAFCGNHLLRIYFGCDFRRNSRKSESFAPLQTTQIAFENSANQEMCAIRAKYSDAKSSERRMRRNKHTKPNYSKTKRNNFKTMGKHFCFGIRVDLVACLR